MRFTKFFLFFISFLLVSIDGFGQSDLENKVIVSLLKNGKNLIPEYRISKRKGWVKSFNSQMLPPLVLLNVTVNPVHDAEFDTLSMMQRNVLTEKDRDMLSDFCEKNGASLKIDSVTGLEKAITFLSDSKRRKIFAGKEEWRAYYADFGLKPFVRVSRPGFNKKMNKAFIYLTYSMGKNDGAGYYLVLKKSFGKWRLKGNLFVWVL